MSFYIWGFVYWMEEIIFIFLFFEDEERMRWDFMDVDWKVVKVGISNL